MGRGDSTRSKRLIQEAMETFEHAEMGLSDAYALLGRWYESEGEFAQAARAYREGLSLDHESDDDLGEARALRRLAGVARQRGDHDQAMEYLDQARSLLAGSEDDLEIAALMTEEGELAVEQSNYELAVGRFLDALRRVEDDGEERAIAVAKRRVALAYREQGDLEGAEALLREAKPVLEERGDLKELNDLLDDLGEVLLERDRYPEAIESIKASLALDEQLDVRVSRARSLLLLGRAYLATGEEQRAGESLRDALEIYEEVDDEVGRSDALFHLGEFQAHQGSLREALKSFRNALLLDSKHNDSVGIARAHRGIAGVYRRRGNLARSQEHIEDATSELLRITDRMEKALLGLEAGRIALDRHDYDGADRYLRDAGRTFEELGCPAKAASCQRLLALVLAERGRYPAALDLLQSSRRVFEESGATPELDNLFDDMGLVYLEMGRPDDARASVERSLTLDVDSGWAKSRGRSQLILGQIALRTNDHATAKLRIDEALASYEDAGDEVGQAATWSLRGDLCMHQREYDAAVKAHKEARRIQQMHGDQQGLAATFRKLGQIYFARGEYQRAEEAFEQAEDHLRASEDTRERGPLYLARGSLAVAQNDHHTAIYHFERALTYFRDQPDNERLSETYRHLASSHQALEHYDQAMTYMREMGLEQAALWKSLLASMHPEIGEAALTKYLAGEYTDAVAEAFSVLERAFQERTEGVDEKSVSGRIRYFVTPEVRGVAPFRDVESLRNFQNFCVSSFGILRNAAVHRWREFNGVDALTAIGVAHLIGSPIDSPEQGRPLLAASADGEDSFRER
jgi:tetratricopeptide (TPR) repeat protein